MTRYVALLRGINVGGRTTVSMAELRAVLASNPFADRQDDPTKLLVAFLSADPTGRADRLASPPGETGQLALAGREVYVHVPDGAGRTKLTTAFIEKRLGVTATARNWRSVLALRELASRRTPSATVGEATDVEVGTAGT